MSDIANPTELEPTEESVGANPTPKEAVDLGRACQRAALSEVWQVADAATVERHYTV